MIHSSGSFGVISRMTIKSSLILNLPTTITVKMLLFCDLMLVRSCSWKASLKYFNNQEVLELTTPTWSGTYYILIVRFILLRQQIVWFENVEIISFLLFIWTRDSQKKYIFITYCYVITFMNMKRPVNVIAVVFYSYNYVYRNTTHGRQTFL